jgi:hypothetical protein
VQLIDRLAAQTGLAVALFGKVGLNCQIFTWRAGNRPLNTASPKGMGGGLQERLTDSAVGWLLLSTIHQPRRDGSIRRLNAEASQDRKFVHAEMVERVQRAQDDGHAVGPAGFGSIADVCAVLLPSEEDGQTMAIGFVYEPSDQIDPQALVRCLNETVARCLTESAHENETLPFSTAA